ncbi:MAG: ribonuclease P protein subunit [Candidatus Thalassarchaeaceae archaeon]|jgi:ribonuclease P protein subunit POP4|nr:ribonuclease P protein subunit [Candidatus Thalassarchaeaceae archaeon]MDP6317928.1 ribonuclease P protein subunit [Candidatus Thalassarchaeaceae archaeon]HJM29667.1 ribonuclease P protein subunit [Candidatus Thalassarchaeaceae archaeon]HJN69875.1 ribonuclease P protein subunit [Candidatus Thalassarchaeaceae archaeon]
MSIYHTPWLARNINVIESTDPTLVGVSGMIVEETRRTLRVRTLSGIVTLPKDVITFTIDSQEVVIDGASVTQRPEDRINRRYRRN